MEKQFTATGTVFNKSRTKTLLVNHKKLNKWVSPGGHIEEDETPDEAVLREIKEETNLDARFISLEHQKLFISSYSEHPLQTPVQILHETIPEYGGQKEHIHLDLIYALEADEYKERSGDEESEWFTKEELVVLDMFDSNKELCLRLMQ